MTALVELHYPHIVLLTGFLGSGKTTLILDYLKDPVTRNTGVIVNEVGEVDVDGAVITSERTGLPLALLSNGCVCCSITSDLPYTIQSLLAEREASGGEQLEQIIVETSGLSRPAPIMRSLLSLKTPVRTSIVSTYDCLAGPAVHPTFEEAMAQIAAAQTIVLTKADRAEPETVAEAREAAGFLNPLARIVEEGERGRRAQSAFRRSGLPKAPDLPLAPRRYPQRLEHERAKVFLVAIEGEPEWPVFVEWMENLVGMCGDRLLRAKGLVRLAGCQQPVLIQGVGTTFDPPRMIDVEDYRSALVVIARDLSAQDLNAVGPTLGIDAASM